MVSASAEFDGKHLVMAHVPANTVALLRLLGIFVGSLLISMVWGTIGYQ